jgi:hypothetical protein
MVDPQSEDSVNPGAKGAEQSAQASLQKSRSQDNHYNQQLKENFFQIIDSLAIQPGEKKYLRFRWLDQLLWMEARATQARNWYRRLRLTAIILGVIVPILVTFNVNKEPKVELGPLGTLEVAQTLKAITIVLSGAIAVSVSLEEFFQFGDRWYSHRRSAELLKTQGWQFFQLSGSYRPYKSHAEAFAAFSEQIETIIQRDVEVYLTEGIQARDREGALQKLGNSEDPKA